MKCKAIHSTGSYITVRPVNPSISLLFHNAEARCEIQEEGEIQGSMLTLLSFAAVPASLLLLIATWPAQTTSIDPQPWASFPVPPVDPEAHFKTVVQIHAELQKRLTEEKPVGVHKMSADESEMFFPRYWQFEAKTYNTKDAGRLGGRAPALRMDVDEGSSNECTNASVLPQALQAPFSLHTEQQLSNHPLFGRLPRAIFPLYERDFHCPAGTADCSSISRPNSCCPTGAICQLITDTGQGDVGCCAQGQTCSGQVSKCQQGYTNCPGSAGGGCCIPGYACVGVGCKYILDCWFPVRKTAN